MGGKRAGFFARRSEIEQQIRDAQDSINKANDGDAWMSLHQIVSEELRSIGFHTRYGKQTASRKNCSRSGRASCKTPLSGTRRFERGGSPSDG
jgi:hypothetical protein